MYFCIRDDDTSFFTSPGELERAYGEVTKHGPVSLAIIPFCRAGNSKGVPKAHREQWSIHALEENGALVEYLRRGIADGRYEAMLHGYHHDEHENRREFLQGSELVRKVAEGKQYLERLLETSIRVFVPPHNAIGKEGLRAITRAGLHLGGVAGMRHGWPWWSPSCLGIWWNLRRRRKHGLDGLPYVLDVVGHRELPGTPITPAAVLKKSLGRFDEAAGLDGVFCAATHYWELDHPVTDPDAKTVGDHLHKLIERAMADSTVRWESVGTVLAESAPLGRRL